MAKVQRNYASAHGLKSPKSQAPKLQIPQRGEAATNMIQPRMNTEWRSRNRIVLVVLLVLVIEPRHPIEDEDEDEDDEENLRGARRFCEIVVRYILFLAKPGRV